ncbi:hypothetical protein [Helicobacter rodentium]|uniref:hypothetical protein n=1 Tax=Helicobacter rodentium TaxID=59617 RepID=UPI0026158DDB|nr:hypothetical protein [Helicobacter rodentium]
MRFHCVQHYRFALKRVSCLRKCTPRSLTISRNDERPKHLLLRHCEAKPKQSIIKHTEILTMESKKARFHIVDCHDFLRSLAMTR